MLLQTPNIKWEGVKEDERKFLIKTIENLKIINIDHYSVPVRKS